MSSGEEQLPVEIQRNLRLLSQILASAPNVPLLIARIWKTINLHLKIKNELLKLELLKLFNGMLKVLG